MTKKMNFCVTYFALSFFVSIQNAYGWVALFNGVSCAGKTTIANEVKKLMPHGSFVVIRYDDKMRDIAQTLEKALANRARELNTTIDKLPATVRVEECAQKNSAREIRAKEEMRNEVLRAVSQGSNVIVDTVVGDDDDSNTLALLNLFKSFADEGIPVFFVLVYCPILKLVERIVKRNSSNDCFERNRIPSQVFSLFARLFSSEQMSFACKPMDAYYGVLEKIDRDAFSKALQDDSLGLTAEQVEECCSLMFDAKVQFPNSWGGLTTATRNLVEFYPTFLYGCILMNNGINTPDELARSFLKQTTNFNLQNCSELAKINFAIQQDRCRQRSCRH